MSDRLGIGTDLEPRYIFPLSRIDQLWEALESHLGVQLSRLHANARRKDADYRWDQEHVNAVSEIFRDDIERFGFDYRPSIKGLSSPRL